MREAAFLLVRHDWWAAAIDTVYGWSIWPAMMVWRSHKTALLRDQFHEDQMDMMGAYCAGGEL